MNNANEAYIFELILHAGNARSKSMEAIYACREKRNDEATQLILEAKQDLISAHKCQTKMLFEEANGEKVEMNVLLVHALDHLSMATITCDLAEEFVVLRNEIRGEQK